ncbi:MAG: hypothetical protein RL113_415 [Pseudomonadota bacterium]|jgi:murein DD-endopeptidase MepM/ murein hydrolase activator NlpD
MKHRHSGQKKSKTGIVFSLVLIGIIAGAGYLYTSPIFEREAPLIESVQNVVWNRKAPIQINLSDNEGLKNYTLVLNDGEHDLLVGQEVFDAKVKQKQVQVAYPKGNILNPKAKHLTLNVSVSDSSLWHLGQGNRSDKTIDIDIDVKRPNVNIVANSYSITQGGSALVVFQAEDENLDTLYVEVGDAKFKAQPYLQKGYYAALIAWPFQEKEFKAKVVAVDRANNVQQVEIPFYLIAHSYDISWIEAKDKFIDGKITDLIESNPEYAESENKLEKLRAVNETMRLKNEAMIHSISKEISSEMLTGWKIHQFYPLRNGQKVASFGDERHYYYQDKGNEVSHSFHVGYDLASTKMAAIQTSNDGKVVFVGDNGIYGNMPMIDHGLGLYSLYGHCSSISVAQGDEVLAGDVIAKTGVTGLALGDHLHFGLLVQGIEVRPVEWFDQDWIRKNVDNVFEEAQKIINGK